MQIKFQNTQLKLSRSENKFCEFWQTLPGETKKKKPAKKPFVTNTLIPKGIFGLWCTHIAQLITQETFVH